jgi:hypothetical protein
VTPSWHRNEGYLYFTDSLNVNENLDPDTGGHILSDMPLSLDCEFVATASSACFIPSFCFPFCCFCIEAVITPKSSWGMYNQGRVNSRYLADVFSSSTNMSMKPWIALGGTEDSPAAIVSALIASAMKTLEAAILAGREET